MQVTAQLKLLPTPDQSASFGRTLIACNAACDYISDVAWRSRTFRQFSLHKLCYRQVRERFGLAAQAAVRAISKVADAYKLDKAIQRTFRPTGSTAYDPRILSYQASAVSIWSLDGRLEIPFACGQYERALLDGRKGESDLALVRGKWYLMATCAVSESEPLRGPAMGVDLGIRNTAATSHGTLHSGASRQQFKQKRHKVRASLQSRNNRAARKALRRLSGREQRRIRWENHNLSKKLVAEAEGTQSGVIRLERLAGIRQRTKIWNKPSNRMVAGWSFAQLQSFVEYKARRCGIRIEYVDPAYTSQTCATCGELGSRRGEVFSCTACGRCHADSNAAVNIAKGGVARPDRGKPTRTASKCTSVSHRGN